MIFCIITDNAPILHDIALLKLDKPAVMSDYVNVICLDMDNGFPPGTPCIAAGWGQNMLGKLVNTISSEERLSIFGDISFQEYVSE